jgi:catalase
VTGFATPCASITGWFDSSGAGAQLSKAVVFKAGRVPMFGRFALAGGHADDA